ncbi:MAG: hypothetical protein ACTSR0_07645 [Candidatus Asgardarchaeia archaeon]
MQIEQLLYILEYIRTFFDYIVPYLRQIITFLDENVKPFIMILIDFFRNISNMLPEDLMSYFIILAVLMALGVIMNVFFEKEED